MEMLNSVEIKGRVGNARIQEYKVNVLQMSVCTEYVSRAKDGTTMIDCTWHKVTYFIRPEDDLKTFEKIGKGSFVHVKGRIRESRYTDASGVERSIYEIVAQSVKVIQG